MTTGTVFSPAFARGLQTAFARDQDVDPIFAGGHNQRLDHSMLADGGGQVLQFFMSNFSRGWRGLRWIKSMETWLTPLPSPGRHFDPPG
jgi:hypothetical protein